MLLKMKMKVVALLAPVAGALAPLAAFADPTDLQTVSTAGVAALGGVGGIAAGYSPALFALTVLGVGIAIGMKYIKKAKGAA